MVILASSSPRRKELLKRIINDFEIKVSNIDESINRPQNVSEIPYELAYRKAKEIARQKNSIENSNLIGKLASCTGKNYANNEIFIVEGDSALGSCKLGRDAEFQAIIPVRGKILNCLKFDYNRIFKSEIITDLIKVLGCGVEIKTKHKPKKHPGWRNPPGFCTHIFK